MRLLTGPAGSGKTATILAELRADLTAGHTNVRLLVPTATLAQHLQNQLAREGHIFPRATIQTLSAFIDRYAAETPQVPGATFHLIVEAAIRRLNLREFARVAHLPGLAAALARTISEFSSAGCDSERLAAHPTGAPLGPAFLAVYREVDRELARHGLATRARRLEIAAQRIQSAGLSGLNAIWLDGFHALPDPELQVIEALARHLPDQLTVTLNDDESETAGRLADLGFTPTHTKGAPNFPAYEVVKAPNIERETEEIARRILEQAAVRPFREIGIIVRAADAYVPILRATLARFGIPARFYFDSPLDQHAAIRFLTGALDAMLAGWDHAATLEVLRLAPRLADRNDVDKFDFEVREQIPAAGLSALTALAPESSPLPRILADLATLDEWAALRLTPANWAARFESLRNLFRPARPPEAGTQDLALALRAQSVALDAFDQAIVETAAALDPQAALPLEDFWRSAKAALRLTPLRLRDSRRNAVQVIGAYEARQWSLPVVFVCGMVEKSFPQFHRADPFFPDSARARLNAAGIRVRTAAEFEQEERALFNAAISRATINTTLTYPEFDSGGERTLPSMFLEGLNIPAVAAKAVRPEPRWRVTPQPRTALAAPALLDYLRQRSARLSPSGLESYLQCAFQYFGNRTLRLKAAPDRPEERLSFLEQGNIVHAVLAAGYAQPDSIERLFDETFEQRRAKLNIPNRYHTERLRNAMLLDLLAFAASETWPRALFTSETEKEFTFALDPTLEIKGRIDRIDTAADGHAYVIDYKYSAKAGVKDRVKDTNLLQGPLYMLAAERAFNVKPDGVFYIGLKKEIEYAGWSHSGLLKSLPIPDAWLETAERRTLEAAHEIRAGRVEAAPANPSKCRYCDCRDICRVSIAATPDPELELEIAEGA